MQVTRLIPGRVLYADNSTIYIGINLDIYTSIDGGNSWKPLVNIPLSLRHRILTRVSLLARLLRKGLHLLNMDGENAILIADKETFHLKKMTNAVHLKPLHGSRPMVLCQSAGVFYYGEYRSNPERSAIHIWQWREGESDWRPVWLFEGIRHVHGVFQDPYSNSIWVTTGDNDSEAGIWRTDDCFQTLIKVVGGSQQFRAVQLLFNKDYVYFGSDAPDEENYIYRMKRNGQGIEPLAAAGAPFFYGCNVGESLFFSTAVEPSRVNTTRNVEVWRSDDSINWYKFLEFKKDYWSMKYFQYGQAHFPNGPGDGKHLFCTPFATQFHGKTLIIPIESTVGKYVEASSF